MLAILTTCLMARVPPRGGKGVAAQNRKDKNGGEFHRSGAAKRTELVELGPRLQGWFSCPKLLRVKSGRARKIAGGHRRGPVGGHRNYDATSTLFFTKHFSAFGATKKEGFQVLGRTS